MAVPGPRIATAADGRWVLYYPGRTTLWNGEYDKNSASSIMNRAGWYFRLWSAPAGTPRIELPLAQVRKFPGISSIGWLRTLATI